MSLFFIDVYVPNLPNSDCCMRSASAILLGSLFLYPEFGSDIRKKNKRLGSGNLSPQFVSGAPFPESGHGPQRHSITLIARLLREKAILKSLGFTGLARVWFLHKM